MDTWVVSSIFGITNNIIEGLLCVLMVNMCKKFWRVYIQFNHRVGKFAHPQFYNASFFPKCLLFSPQVMFNSLWPHGLWPTKLFYPWYFPGKITGVGFHFLHQGIFLTLIYTGRRIFFITETPEKLVKVYSHLYDLWKGLLPPEHSRLSGSLKYANLLRLNRHLIGDFICIS